MKTGKLPTVPKCTNCLTELDGWTNPFRMESPKEGDITVCGYCGEVLKFNGELMLEKTDADDIQDVLVELSRVQRVVKKVNMQQ